MKKSKASEAPAAGLLGNDEGPRLDALGIWELEDGTLLGGQNDLGTGAVDFPEDEPGDDLDNVGASTSLELSPPLSDSEHKKSKKKPPC